jgi:hypothetical protein
MLLGPRRVGRLPAPTSAQFKGCRALLAHPGCAYPPRQRSCGPCVCLHTKGSAVLLRRPAKFWQGQSFGGRRWLTRTDRNPPRGSHKRDPYVGADGHSTSVRKQTSFISLNYSPKLVVFAASVAEARRLRRKRTWDRAEPNQAMVACALEGPHLARFR